MFQITDLVVGLSIFLCAAGLVQCQDILGCGGFVKSEVEINFSLVEVKLYTKQGSLKYQTDCAPNNGYYMIPIYDKGDYVLKVEPPPGWTFDPQSVELHIDGKTDMCSKGEDINFQFTGFGVVGSVISKGKNTGPSGVTLTLSKVGSEEVLKQTTSGQDGIYTFENVLPGDYNIKGSHSAWTFETATALVKVDRETGNAGSTVVVLGYDVKGKVLSEGEPIKGVYFILFSTNVKEVHGCDKSPVKGFPTPVGHQPLCHVASSEDGTFTFPSLLHGKYTVVPFYKGDHITFDVVPTQLEFSVEHNSHLIEETFEVTGFSVSGKVLNAAKGVGIAGAKVFLNGLEQAQTGADGTYHLESMKPGTYTLTVTGKQVYFDETVVKVTPNTPELPDIIATRFSLCGRVVIDKIPDELSQVPQNRQMTLTSGEEVSQMTTDADGAFCAEVRPGTYALKVVLSEGELHAGLRLAPDVKEVKVVDRPVTGITFSQFRAKVQGSILCLETCGELELTLQASGRVEKQKTLAVVGPKGATFVFTDVMPGKYEVTLNNEEWCWKEKSLQVEVVDQDMVGLRFEQNGYFLKCSLSHDILLNFAQENKPGNVGSFDLKKGVNKFCLGEPGVYQLTPASCHKFEQDTYRYDTAHPTVLTMTAIKHKVEGSITTQDPKSDIIVSIKTSVDGEKPVQIGPLVADKTPPAPKSSKDKAVVAGGPFTYSFTYWARTGERLEISATSQELLFYPSSSELTVLGDVCASEVVTFEGKQGVFIIGQITPHLAGVKITITPENNAEASIMVETSERGAYKVGPLHSDTSYGVAAEKEGYVLTEVPERQGDFRAFKLGEVSVKMTDDNDVPLQGVLLSLSGGTQYRSNKLSLENGEMMFIGLSPGHYFLRPMMKEYSFLPSSQMIEVLEGSTVKLEIKGTRVAFSCYGSVTSLNGEAEPGVFVEAVGMGSEQCDQLQEESKTEKDGSYRIRGLQIDIRCIETATHPEQAPNCEYEIRLKTGDVNQHIERSAPKSRNVKALDSDLTNMNIIAFRRMNQLDLSGNVVTDSEFLNTLKVRLYREDNPDAPIHTVNLGATSFFYLPSLTIDNQRYLVRLDSSLSRHSYDYILPEILFTANTSYQHFTFKFEPQGKPLEQELSQSSFMVLPLTLLIILAGYHHQKILPFLVQGSNTLQNILARPASSNIGHASNSPLEISPELLGDAPSGKKKRVRKA